MIGLLNYFELPLALVSETVFPHPKFNVFRISIVNGGIFSRGIRKVDKLNKSRNTL